MRKALQERAGRAIVEKVFPGCVIGIVKADGEREVFPFGRFTYDVASPEVREDTIYDMASVTKSVPVAALVAVLVGEGRLSLGDTVVKYLPELHKDHGATIEDLLRYRVSGPRLSTLPFKTFEEIRTHILETGFAGPAGKETYSNVPAFILGMVLERVSGKIVPALAEEYFFGPLQMRDTTFFPHDISRIPPTEVQRGKEVHGIVHDESARVFARARSSVGHAGLFSTAPDILDLFEALMSGDYAPVSRAAEAGLGWQVAQSWFMGEHCSERTFGKTGFTGTSVVCDIKRGIALVILSNRTYPKRPADAAELNSAMNRFRADIADLVME
jgi:CubicO group peptidase (beta-lactamase class C family)